MANVYIKKMHNKIKISDEFKLRYQNKSIDDFQKICEEIIVLLGEISN